ncbi:NAD(P)/FAD-dependent oxidoreductase [Amycolatopsis taiwanensis]|uniref:Pyridine nucleotide-disulfide oxidoreductase n=1 Tax=Amycolatopsis taiwanensis TaxID=342230 RepID=A0A9W6QU31_9PSEU|nr:FAD-dependent oxidoreductase [Amycolatopsis taiwanensis]GLY64219.1 pyridine nucleotide-disulfide oxidoreductase [Amycolatopsis taiwanensis]
MDQVVIVGAGHGGVQVADSLRHKGFPGAVTVIGEESALPYQRPPLSKDFLAETPEPQPLPLRAQRFFVENRINLRTDATVTALDRARQVVVLDGGEELPYTALVLATGATTRTLAVPGIDLAGVHELRTLSDAGKLRAALGTARSVVVVGAGFIGLEFAAAARKRGVDVTVIEAAERPMGRAVSPEMGDFFAGAHRRMGTDLRLGEGLGALVEHRGSVAAAVGTSGREYPADLVLVGVGIQPRDELARAAGLEVDNGIVVDEHLRTADHAVYAIGDCAAFPNASAGARVRLESVQNATEGGRHVADMILGTESAYTEVPWFWSHQGPLRLQIAGLTRLGDDTVISGDVHSGRFSVCCFRDGRLVAVESVNRPADYLAARRLLAAGACPTPEQVADPAFSLKDHAKRLTSPR